MPISPTPNPKIPTQVGQIQVGAISGLSLYAQNRTLAGTVWNSSTQAYETLNTSNWASYLISLDEPVAGSGAYFGAIPQGLPAGTSLLPIYQQTGVAAASTDSQLDSWPLPAGSTGAPGNYGGLTLILDWSGTAINSLGPYQPRPGSGVIQLPAPQDSLAYAQQALTAWMAAELSLASNGFAAVSIDGQTVTYRDPGMIGARIDYWRRRVALLSGHRRRVSSIRLNRF